MRRLDKSMSDLSFPTSFSTKISDVFQMLAYIQTWYQAISHIHYFLYHIHLLLNLLRH